MRMRDAGLPARMKWTAWVLALALMLSALPAAAAVDAPAETAIVWIADVSGSVPEADPQMFWADAVSLGVDIAPENTRVAFLAVSDSVTGKTSLRDVSEAFNRDAIKRMAQNAVISSYTDFSAGLWAALDLLEPSSAEDKHIFFMADFCEAGFLPQDGDYSHVAGDMGAITKRLADNGIKVHLLFVREPVQNQQFVPLWEDLAAATDGELIYIDDPATLPQTVASCYFREFEYNSSVTTSVKTVGSAKEIPIRLPSFALERARIYISADVALTGVQVRADGVKLDCEQNRSYLLIDLIRLLPETVTLYMPPGHNNAVQIGLPQNQDYDVRIYLLADGTMSLNAAPNSEAERTGMKYRQKTTVNLSPICESGPLFDDSAAPDAEWTLTVTNPDGQAANADAQYENGSFNYDFYPETFGTYIFTLTVASQGISLSAETSAEISAIKLPLPRELWIALATGILLILAAILIACFHRRRERTVGPLVPIPIADPGITPIKDGVFTGKLDIYGVLVEGGKAEIPAASFPLGELGKSKYTTLGAVMEESGILYHYPDAANIVLSPGQNGTLLIKNLSDAVIYCGGQAWYKGQLTVLSYGQKMRAVFEEDVSEYEIYYHRLAQMAGSHVHVEYSNQTL